MWLNSVNVYQWPCITKAAFWTFLSSPTGVKIVKRFFHAGFVLAGAPGLGSSASQVQNMYWTNVLAEILGTLSPRLGMRTVTFQKNRFFWVILAGILLIHLFTSLSCICLGLDPKPRENRERSWVDPPHGSQKAMDSHKWGYGMETGWGWEASQRPPLTWLPPATPLLILKWLSNISFPGNDQTLGEQVELFKFTRGGHTHLKGNSAF